MAPVIMALKREPWVRCTVALTAQHRELLDSALAVFGVSADVDLDLMQPGQSLGSLTGHMHIALEAVLRQQKPDLVLAQGDTTTVMVAAMSCFYMGIPFGHVEAGLRSGSIANPFPEEVNRIIASRVAKLHFAPTARAADALLAEGVARDDITITGNTVIDALLDVKSKAPRPDITLAPNDRLLLVTAHRRESFGERLASSMQGLRRVVDARPDLHVLFPVHLNPNVRGVVGDVLGGHARIHLCEPMDYLAFVGAMSASEVILTDSGGVQEEAPALGKPVLVMRERTERPEAVEMGVARLIGSQTDQVESWVGRLLDDALLYQSMVRPVSPYGDGNAAARIVQVIATYFGQVSTRPVEGEFRAQV